MNARGQNVITLVAVLVLTACSAGTSTPPANTTAPNAAGVPTATSYPVAPAKAGNACDRKLLTAADMAGILGEPITGTKPLTGDAQTCYFVTATTETQGGPEIMISLRPGLGQATIATFTSGKMDKYAKSVPLTGVGDGRCG